MTAQDKAESWWAGWENGVQNYDAPGHAESWRACPYYRAGFKKGTETRVEAAKEAGFAFGWNPQTREKQ